MARKEYLRVKKGNLTSVLGDTKLAYQFVKQGDWTLLHTNHCILVRAANCSIAVICVAL